MQSKIVIFLLGIAVGMTVLSVFHLHPAGPQLYSHPVADPYTASALGIDQKPNNQYELLVYPDHFDLYDGKKFVAMCGWDSCRVLETIVSNDNQ